MTSPDWLSTLSYPAPKLRADLGFLILWLLFGFGWVISPRPIGGSRVRSGYYHSGFLYILGLDVPWAKGHSSVGCPSPPPSLSPQVPWWLPYLAPSGLGVLMRNLCHLPWGSAVSHVAFLYAVHNSGKNPFIKFTILPIWVHHCFLLRPWLIQVCSNESVKSDTGPSYGQKETFFEMHQLWHSH